MPCRLVILVFAAAAAAAQPSGFVASSRVCAACHAGIYETYQRSGMAQSFYRPQLFGAVNDFYHPASDTHYSMFQRDGRYYQRRWQIGFAGKEENVEEMQVDYVLGSGNHARTYLHRTTRGTLIQLPLGWYAEKGGYWGMNPGYDTPHPPARRPIAYECMFCHNAYPVAGAASAGEPVFAGAMPEGIDCQRCHGPGAKHAQTARGAAAKREEIRASIVNPRRLSPERQTEVCMQCHLETTSTRLPGLLRRFDRAPFTYVPGQPLGAFAISFDHAPGSGHEDKFEIAGSAYRFRQSQCFLKSAGRLTCITCHDPHNIPRGQEATVHYAAVCRQCHAPALDRLVMADKHSPDKDCVTCHMPKRRTDDAVHVAMTDHLIQRRPPARDLLAEIRESHPAAGDWYRGEVVPYYPSPLPPTAENAIYKAVAQVAQGSNLQAGVAVLSSELRKVQPVRADFYMALGDAYHEAGEPSKAVGAYEQAVRLQPGSARASRYLGIALQESGQPARAQEALRRAVQLAPTDAQGWFGLGLLQSAAGRTAEAIANIRRAIALNPDLADSQNSLGANLAASGDVRGAEEAFRDALRIDPSYAPAHGSLGRLLTERGELEEALFHYGKAVRLQGGYAPFLYEYGLTFVRLNRFDESEEQARAAVRADPNLAEAHELLGGLLARKRDFDAALPEFEAAVRLKPDFSRAQLDLGATLAGKGDMAGAILHLREAAKGSDPEVAQQALGALRRLGASQ